VIACFAEGETEIVGAAVARHKESDRIHAIATELKKMGARVEEKKDGLVMTSSSLSGACLQSYADHRMALALTVAALAARGESVIEGAECMAKTYPTFKRDFQALGASIA
jgi:5-enolpyruvylshikimate-3-phosphate synthase